MLYFEVPGVEIVDVDCILATGSLPEVKQKFAKANRQELLNGLATEMFDGTLYLGDWRKGEIQITGVKRVISNRYWTEIEYIVLFPPRNGSLDPAEGTYRNLVWNSGVDAGAGAFLLTEEQEIVMVKSFRHAPRKWTFELPRGVKLQNETPAQTARREAEEECGAIFTSRTEVIDFGVHLADTGMFRQDVPIIAFTNVKVDENKVSRDVSESFMAPVVVSLDQFFRMLCDNTIQDGWIQGAVLQAIARGLLQPA